MNFLSHFYFDRHSEDPHLVLGAVLPDLVKNARKDWNLHPERNSELFNSDFESSILEGWKRHMIVDRHFHNSVFFAEHTSEIKKAIIPALKNSVVRPSFLAHISLELMLDSTLLTENHIQTVDFYSHLRQSDREAINRFLKLSSIDDTTQFFNFFDKFIQSNYLETYRESYNIMYALNRICMRVWKDPLTASEIINLSDILKNYQQNMLGNYMEIFEEINLKLMESGERRMEKGKNHPTNY
jgi:acyl carrier protein phosphodiesterase